MKKWILILIVTFSIQQVFAELSFPKPTGLLNDFANILDDSTEQQVQALLDQIKTETSAEVAVVTVQSLEGYDANSYAVALGRAWGVGNKERDDGVVFLTAVQDRKVYIATGYGVEGYITDAQSFWITDQVVVPYFKQGDYNAGILAGTEKIKEALVDLEALPSGSSSSTESDLGAIIFAIFFAMSFIVPWIAAVLGRSKRWWPGGVVGGVMGYGLSLLFSITMFIILPLALFGFLIDYLASKNYKKGKDNWWTGGGSSGWGGSSWGGGSSSSGGFGGFSGGSFGGGGGGSSW